MVQTVVYFPGQGAQQVGMLTDLAQRYAIVSDTFSEASDAIDQDLWSLVQQGPAATLNLTYNTQPALVTASAAIWRVLQQELGSALQIKAAAGHSVGEYAALYSAGILSLSDAVRLVKQRGTLMDNAVPAGRGGMAAILGLDKATIARVCHDAAAVGVVEPANFNAPGQIVIAGTAAAVEEACKLAKAAGAKRALPLSVSGPFHSSLMKQAAEPFVEALNAATWQPGQFDVYHNADNQTASLDLIKQRLIEQLYSPVDWIGAVNNSAQGVELAIEVGPGKVISGLNKRIDKSLTTLSSGDVASIEKIIQHVRGES